MNAARVFDFTNSIGVNTHLSDTAGPYGKTAQVKSELDYVGIHYVRDLPPLSWSVKAYAALLNTGVKIDLNVDHNPDQELGNGGLQADLALIDQMEGLAPGSIFALEGLNEPQNFPQLYNGQPTTNWATVALVQSMEYAAVKADPALSGLPFLSPSVDPGNMPGTPADFTNTADLGNSHVYPYGGLQPSAFITAGLAGQQSLVHGKPAWITEFGYSSTPGDSSYGVDSATQAKNTLNGLLDAFKAGVAKTFLYQLLDETSNIPPGTAWGALGLFNADGTPKPVAAALHNLSAILADPAANAATFQPRSLDVSILGLPSTASEELFEKSDGTFEVAIWNEPTDWNPATQSEAAAAATPITVSGSQAWGAASVFDPLAGAAPVATYTGVNSVQLSLTDHPLILQISPGTAQAAAAPSISFVTGVSNTGVRLTGTSEAGSTVTVTDTVNGQTKVLGSSTASPKGAWSFLSASGLGRIDLSTVHDYSVSASTAAGATSKMAGGLFLTDTGHDVLTATPGVSDVFAIMSNSGSDVINGFQAASAGASGHDVINFSGRGLTSFSQVRALMSGSGSAVITLAGGKAVTLAGVAPSALSAADFRFS